MTKLIALVFKNTHFAISKIASVLQRNMMKQYISRYLPKQVSEVWNTNFSSHLTHSTEGFQQSSQFSTSLPRHAEISVYYEYIIKGLRFGKNLFAKLNFFETYL